MQSDDNGFYNHEIQKLKSPLRWSCLYVDRCGNAIVFSSIFFFNKKRRWIIVLGKAGKIKMLLVSFKVNHSSKKVIRLAAIHNKCTILAPIFTLYFIFQTSPDPGGEELFCLLWLHSKIFSTYLHQCGLPHSHLICL